MGLFCGGFLTGALLTLIWIIVMACSFEAGESDKKDGIK